MLRGRLLGLRVDLKLKFAEKDLMRGEEVPIDRRYNNNETRRMNTAGMCPSPFVHLQNASLFTYLYRAVVTVPGYQLKCK